LLLFSAAAAAAAGQRPFIVINVFSGYWTGTFQFAVTFTDSFTI
jgi:hypothetical protein